MYQGGRKDRPAGVPKADEQALSVLQMVFGQELLMKAITFAHSATEQVSRGGFAEVLPGDREEHLHRRFRSFRMDQDGNFKWVLKPGFSLPEELSDEV